MMKIRVPIKPLSINQCWQGRRFKTREYQQYERSALLIMPKQVEKKGYLEVHIRLFLTSINRSDVDNYLKPILDICQKRGYYKNDNKIIRLTAEKVLSPNDGFEIDIKEAVESKR